MSLFCLLLAENKFCEVSPNTNYGALGVCIVQVSLEKFYIY